jgi:hypothetical protein
MRRGSLSSTLYSRIHYGLLLLPSISIKKSFLMINSEGNVGLNSCLLAMACVERRGANDLLTALITSRSIHTHIRQVEWRSHASIKKTSKPPPVAKFYFVTLPQTAKMELMKMCWIFGSVPWYVIREEVMDLLCSVFKRSQQSFFTNQKAMEPLIRGKLDCYDKISKNSKCLPCLKTSHICQFQIKELC